MEEPSKTDLLCNVLWAGKEFLFPKKTMDNEKKKNSEYLNSLKSCGCLCLGLVVFSFTINSFINELMFAQAAFKYKFWPIYPIGFTILVGIICYFIYKSNVTKIEVYTKEYEDKVKEIKSNIENYEKALCIIYQDLKSKINEWLAECSPFVHQYVLENLESESSRITFSEINSTNIVKSTMIPERPQVNELHNELQDRTVITPIPIPPKMGYLVYLLTENSLIVAPAESANLTKVSGKSFIKTIWDSFLNIDFPLAVDLKKISFSLDEPVDPKIVLDLPKKISFVELFFQEMINTEYSFSTESQRNSITITMRDGLQFRYMGSQEFSDKLQNALRKFKSTLADMDSSSRAPVQQQEQIIPEEKKDTKVCPMCAEEVKAAAKICRFCQYKFVEEGEQ
ncbi:MAG: zinc ribbon domain-containing protein [Vulcanimicrobiota bacterium]